MEAERDALSAPASARIALTLSTAIILVAVGVDRISVPIWLGGAGTFIALTMIGKGYWRREVRRQLLAVGGAKVALMVFIGVALFNLFLSALFLGAGNLIGLSWRAMT
jgi:hypothetical protein